MHVTTTGKGTVFVHNGDFSGDVTVNSGASSLVVPNEDILEFVAEYIRLKRIAQLESMPWQRLLFAEEEK